MLKPKPQAPVNPDRSQKRRYPTTTATWIKRYHPVMIILILLGLALFFVLDDVLMLFLLRFLGFMPGQWWLFILISFYLFLLSLGLAYAVVVQMRKRPTTGIEGIVGASGITLTRVFDTGHVRVRGEIWHAKSSQPISPNRTIVVETVDHMTLSVRESEAVADETNDRQTAISG